MLSPTARGSPPGRLSTTPGPLLLTFCPEDERAGREPSHRPGRHQHVRVVIALITILAGRMDASLHRTAGLCGQRAGEADGEGEGVTLLRGDLCGEGDHTLPCHARIPSHRRAETRSSSPAPRSDSAGGSGPIGFIGPWIHRENRPVLSAGTARSCATSDHRMRDVVEGAVRRSLVCRHSATVARGVGASEGFLWNRLLSRSGPSKLRSPSDPNFRAVPYLL